jgi:hypothetical protein
MKIIDIVEARKNPEQNPKLTPDEQLDQIVERYGDDLFVRLSGIPKFGANPTAEYNTTPLGFYAYPADYTIENGINGLPYPRSDSPDSRYVVVFKLMPNAVVWNLGDDDLHILNRVYASCRNLITRDHDRENFEQLKETKYSTGPEANNFSDIWRWFRFDQDDTVGNELADEFDDLWLSDFEKRWQLHPATRKRIIQKVLPGVLEGRGFDLDDDAEFINNSIKAAITDPNSADARDVYDLHIESADWKNLYDDNQLENLESKLLRSKGIYTMRDVADLYPALSWPESSITDSKGFWQWIKHTRVIPGETPSRFRRILLDAGIDAVIDPGLSIIHRSEPNQSVFFTISKIKQVGLIDKHRTGLPIRHTASGQPMPDTTYAQLYTGVKQGRYALAKVPRQFRDYKMCLAAIAATTQTYVTELPSPDALAPGQYSILVNRIVTMKPWEICKVRRGSIPEDDYIALWKQSVIADHSILRAVPIDVKDIIIPSLNAPVNVEVDRVKELAERLLR